MESRYSNSRAIIFKIHKAKEADRVVHLLTEEGERVVAIAKGVKKVTSRKAHAIDLLNHVELKFAQKSGLPIITEVKLLNDVQHFKQEINSLYLTQLVCEVIDTFAIESAEEPGLYRNLTSLMSVWDVKKLRLLTSALILRYLYLSGDLPKLDEDIFEGTEIAPGEKRFATNQIGYTSRAELAGFGEISDRTYKVQRFILRSDFNQVAKLALTDAEQEALLELHIHWLELLTDRPVKSYKIWKEVIHK